jgi:hypothetical protein
LDDTAGTAISDEIGTIGDGTISGSDYILNQDGVESGSKSIYFGGTDQIDLPDGFADFTNGVTLEAWCKPNVDSTPPRIIELAVNSNGDDHIQIIVFDTVNDLYASADDTGGALEVNGMIENGVWKHFIFRILPDYTKELWVNGVKVGTNDGTSMPSNITRTINLIGYSSMGGDRYFKGNLSHIAIYDYPLSEEDIWKHMRRGFSTSAITMKSIIKSDSPSFYWTFDRLKTVNEEINDKHLTLNGAVTYNKNSVVINEGSVGNNYLYNNDVHVNLADTGSWALEFSFRTVADHTTGIIVSEWDQGTNTGTYKVQLEAAGVMKCYLATGASSLDSTADYSDGEWHHVVITAYDGTFDLYVDDVLEDTLATSLTYETNRFTIGNDSTADVGTYLDEETHIDDVAIYPINMAEFKIEEHYNQFVKKKGTLQT